MPQTNSAQISEQPTTPENLHALFQQLCFTYGALSINNKSISQSQFKWISEDAQALAELALKIHNANGGI